MSLLCSGRGSRKVRGKNHGMGDGSENRAIKPIRKLIAQFQSENWARKRRRKLKKPRSGCRKRKASGKTHTVDVAKEKYARRSKKETNRKYTRGTYKNVSRVYLFIEKNQAEIYMKFRITNC